MYGSLYIQIIMIGLVVSSLVYALWKIRKGRKTLNFNRQNAEYITVCRYSWENGQEKTLQNATRFFVRQRRK